MTTNQIRYALLTEGLLGEDYIILPQTRIEVLALRDRRANTVTSLDTAVVADIRGKAFRDVSRQETTVWTITTVNKTFIPVDSLEQTQEELDVMQRYYNAYFSIKTGD